MDNSPWPGPLALVAALPRAAPAVAHGFTGTDWGLLVALLIVLVLAGLASASETALTSISRIKIRNLAEEGDSRAQLIERLLREPNIFLSTILVVNNVAVIVASTLSTLIALDTFASWGEVISTVLISLIVLVFCEITPKTAAVQAPERWALAVVRPVYATSLVLKPIIVALTYVTGGLVRLFGGKPRVKGPFVTEEELRLLVEVGEEEGVLEEEEREMIHNVFDLGDTTAREVMVPRIDMVTIEADEPIEEAVSMIVQGGQSRIPVYSESIDNIIGVLYAKDLLRVLATNQRPATVRAMVRPAYFVPETKRLDDLLHELQAQRVHIAIVVDEYGGVAGLVTIEDVVEEIIGDIQDEYDREEVLYEKLSPDEYIVDAKISVDDFNDLLDTDMPAEDYDTLGGFVYSQLDKIPSVGDTLRYKDLTFTVLGTKGRRITKVKVVRGLPAVPPEGAAGGDTSREQPPSADHRDRAREPLPPPVLPPPTGMVPGSLGAAEDRILHAEAAASGEVQGEEEGEEGGEPHGAGESESSSGGADAPVDGASADRSRAGGASQPEDSTPTQRSPTDGNVTRQPRQRASGRNAHARNLPQSRHR
jgi:putative hemolysin